jgi:two-component system NtrC family sensor kinase
VRFLLQISRPFPQRRWLLPILLLSLLSGPLAAQQGHKYWDAKPDSLRQALATQHTDTARLRTLQHMADLAPDESDDYLREQDYEELIALTERLHRPERRAYRLLRKGHQLFKSNTLVPALDSLKAAIAEFDRLNRPVPILLVSIRFLFNAAGQQQAKRAYYEGKLAYYRRRGDAASIAACYHGLAGYYNSRGDRNQAIGYYLQAAEGYRAFRWDAYYDELAAAGQVYAEWGNLEKARHYLQQSVAGQGSQRGQLPLSVGYRNRVGAEVQLQLHNYPAALHAIDLALAAGAHDTNAVSEKAYGLVLKSATLLALRRPREAGPLLHTAQHLADSLQLPFRSGSGDFELDAAWARYYAALGNDVRAGSHWLTAYRKAHESGSANRRLAYLHELTRFYQHRQPAVAATYALAALGLADTLRAAEGALNVTRYETEQADHAQSARIADLRLAQVQDAARARRQRLLLGATLAVLALLAGLGFVLWRGNRQKQRANEQLNLLNEAVMAQKGELQTQRDQLDASLTDLRTTQAQLIQKEKMASLGELTAGIAHEIQNPLNFVNNFADVSTELLAELKEAQAAGDATEVALLLEGVTQNLGKIHQHGQRAASIVRGMLEHSRTSTGDRAPTDLNTLCDEYLRLSYQGLRANDKSFNAALKTEFTPGLPLVQAAGADLGRVLLNLFGNAFYAVRQRQQAGETGYAPRVSVATKQVGQQVEIRVSDNGMGIPEGVKAKVFQPFFTTKPPGEGTGLGLSLSYDIVTKGHGGTLTVASCAGQGTEFLITLPV